MITKSALIPASEFVQPNLRRWSAAPRSKWKGSFWEPGRNACHMLRKRSGLTRDGTGYLAWRAQASPLTVHIVTSSHGGPERWAETAEQYGSLLGRAGLMGVETDWQEAGERQYGLSLKLLARYCLGIQTMPDLFVSSYAGQKTIRSAAIPIDVDGPRDWLRLSLRELIYNPALSRFGITDMPERPLGRFLAPSIYLTIREEMLVGMIGNALQIDDRFAQLEKRPRTNEMAVVLGTNHAGYLPRS